MSTDDEELDWLHDYIIQFLKSPSFKIPLVTFIDENCVVFDDEEENKINYTEVHNKFKQLVEDLIDFHLKDIQVTEEAFVRACNISKSPSDKKVFDQILAVDNFVAFKKLMVNRNRELEQQVHQAIQGNDKNNATQNITKEMPKNNNEMPKNKTALAEIKKTIKPVENNVPE
jgi:uncharacterized UPF0160 family protein